MGAGNHRRPWCARRAGKGTWVVRRERSCGVVLDWGNRSRRGRRMVSGRPGPTSLGGGRVPARTAGGSWNVGGPPGEGRAHRSAGRPPRSGTGHGVDGAHRRRRAARAARLRGGRGRECALASKWLGRARRIVLRESGTRSVSCWVPSVLGKRCEVLEHVRRAGKSRGQVSRLRVTRARASPPNGRAVRSRRSWVRRSPFRELDDGTQLSTRRNTEVTFNSSCSSSEHGSVGGCVVFRPVVRRPRAIAGEVPGEGPPPGTSTAERPPRCPALPPERHDVVRRAVGSGVG